MPWIWKRNQEYLERLQAKQQERINQIAKLLREQKVVLGEQIDEDKILATAKKISDNPLREFLFSYNRLFLIIEKRIWEPMLEWANTQALLGLLGLAGNVGLIIAVLMYIGSEKQRRDAEILNAWQTLTNAYGQPGNGGRIHALEFLNASPRNVSPLDGKYYPGANWRRRASCLWICTWERKSLAGIDLSTIAAGISVPDESGTALDDTKHSYYPRRAFLKEVQLPGANLESANLEGADLTGANLEGASLVAANLKSTDLSSANLQGANLSRTNLQESDLSGANLKGAILRTVNLDNTVGLENADLEDTDLAFSNLREVRRHISQDQVSKAKLCLTKLPDRIALPSNRDCKELNIQVPN